MKFGPVPVAELEGLILAHSVRAGNKQYRKGERVTAEMAAELAKAGLKAAYGVELEPGDVEENKAAVEVARLLEGTELKTSTPATGRVNLFSRKPGLLQIDTDGLARLNEVDEGITIATLPGFSPVQADQLVATVKIIPFAVRQSSIDTMTELTAQKPPIDLAPFRSYRVWILLSRWPGTPDRLIDKSLKALSSRVERLGSHVLGHSIVEHNSGAVESALSEALQRDAELILCLGASATADRRDILPEAIESLGGEILRFGIPVDPGNLVLSGRLNDRPVLVLPGSARSERRSGADWLLERTVAGLGLDSTSLAKLGEGGLLKEMRSRPRPRLATGQAERPAQLKVAGLLLAAGASRRMENGDKLLRDLHGRPLVAHTASRLASAGLAELVAVTRPNSGAVTDILSNAGFEIIENADAGEGMGSSIRKGVEALPEDVDAVLIALGDMPLVSKDTLVRLVGTLRSSPDSMIAVPTHKGRAGNPVLFRRQMFNSLMRLSGDQGARGLIAEMGDNVIEVDVDDKGILQDFDTKAAFEHISGEDECE